MLLHLIPPLDSESIRMFKDGPLEKLRGRGGEFSSRINLFSLLFSLYVLFCSFEWIFFRVNGTLRAVFSPGRTLRFDGKETTASNRLLFHRAWVMVRPA